MRQPGIEHTLPICGKPDSSLAIRDRLDALIASGSGSIAVGFGDRGHKRNYVIPVPVIGHWMKQGWGTYAGLTKLGRFRQLPGL